MSISNNIHLNFIGGEPAGIGRDLVDRCPRLHKEVQAEEFKRRSHAGMVMVNVATAEVDYHVTSYTLAG